MKHAIWMAGLLTAGAFAVTLVPTADAEAPAGSGGICYGKIYYDWEGQPESCVGTFVRGYSYGTEVVLCRYTWYYQYLDHYGNPGVCAYPKGPGLGLLPHEVRLEGPVGATGVLPSDLPSSDCHVSDERSACVIGSETLSVPVGAPAPSNDRCGGSIVVVLETAAGTYYADVRGLRLDGQEVPTPWIYEESNGVEGLQVGDEHCDETNGDVDPDTRIF